MIRCGSCRTRRAGIGMFTRHLVQHPECRPCNCGGYHFPHRRGSPCCEAHPYAPANAAARAGADPLEVEAIRAAIEEDRRCPF